LVHVPAKAVRTAVSLSWHARVQQLDAGWIDLAYAVPLLDTSRAASELGWSATRDGVSVLAETVDGMSEASADRSPVLRPRSVPDALSRFARRGPVSSRQQP
jgi:UDP-glucose 4-epimerase